MISNVSSRRHFLTSAAALTGAALSVPSFGGFVPGMQGKNKLGVAVAGLGNYANTIVGKAVSEADRCYVAGVASGTPSKAQS